MNEAKIEIKNLHKAFGKKVVLDGIDLNINKGESLVVIGGSGTGKSVLIKCIQSLLTPDMGSIKIDGTETVGAKGIVNIPHLGASTYESEDNCAIMAAHELDEFLTCGNIKNSVNLPNVSLPHTGAARVCLLHKNIPNMLGQITAIVSARNVNIENMANGSRGEYGYTIVELKEALPPSAEAAFNAIDGMIRVTFYN